jgi:rsbT co-antagonist protein RsbR
MDSEDAGTDDLDTQSIEALRDRVRELERREADRKEAVASHQRALDALPDLFCVQSLDGRFLHVNRAFCEFYGKSPEELIGAANGSLLLASSPEADAERRAQVIASGIFVDIPSERLKQPSGVDLPFNTLWCPIKNKAGTVGAIAVRARGLRGDIVEERETALKASTHTKALLNIIPDMFFRVDRSGTYIDFSAGRGLDTALPPSLFLGKRIQDVTPDVAPWALPAIEEALRTGDVQRHEFKLFAQGAYLDYEARVLPSGPDEVLFLVREISKQKKTEQKLREADARFRALEEQSMFGIFIVQEGALRYTNPKLAAIVGAEPADLLAGGLPLTLFDHADRPVMDAFLGDLEAQQAKGDSGVQRTFRARRRDGSLIYVDIFGSKVVYGGQPAIIGIVLDVTEVRRGEEERARLQEEMMRIQDAMMVELSTPLIPISDDILVMPLIGSIDEKRAQLVMERLLHGVTSFRAKAVILDVTGLASVNTHTAGALARCAQAVRLLGARALMTGLRPDVAQTLVGMNVDLGGIATLSTLKAGIACALGNGSQRAARGR